MKITRLAAAVAGAALAVTALAGCGATAGTPGDASAAGGPKIGLIMLQGDTYFQGIQSGLDDVVKADGGSVTTGLSNNDPATENQVAQNMIQAQVDAVLIQPTADEASLATMQSIKDAGIAVICYGNCVGATAEPDVADGVIQSDNTALGTGTGEVAAAYAKENIGDSLDLAILNCDIASACKLRKTGFLAGLEDAGIKVNVVTDQEAYLVDKATPVAADILAANPDIDMIWASNDGGTAGATIAVEQANVDVPVFGTDISTQIAEFLLDDAGMLVATTGQDPLATAKGAYDMAKKVVAGEKVDAFSVELPGIVYDRSQPDTIDEFLGN